MSANANIRAGRAYVEVTAETSKLKQKSDTSATKLPRRVTFVADV